MNSVPVKQWLPRFVLLSAIWGTSFLFIKVGVESFAPLQVAWVRVALGALVLLPIVVRNWSKVPHSRSFWLRLGLIATLANSIPFALFAWGETRLSSVFAGLVNAMTPLSTILVVTLILGDEVLTRRRLVGLGVGFGGALVLFGVWEGTGGIDLLAAAALLGATFCYAFAIPLGRRLLHGSAVPPSVFAGLQLITASAQLGVVTALATDAPSSFPLDAVGSIAALGVFGTGFAYLLYYGLLRDVGATTLSMVTYVTPVFATVAGVVVLNESLTWYQPVGAVIVLGAVWFAERSGGSQTARAPLEATP